MELPGWIARPINDRDRTLIADATLWHLTKPKFAEFIRQGPAIGTNREIVNLKASQGWSINPTKLIRDWSIWDEDFNSKDYSCYLYFFINKPSSSELRFLKLQGITSSIQIEGSDLLKHCNSRIFIRKSDSAVVVRGGYTGPGIFNV